MKKILLSLTLLVSAISFAQKPIFTSAKTKAATVYFSGAEITQSTSVNLPVGTSEIVIKNVADYLNENTVQIAALKSVTVLSVQFSDNYVSEYVESYKHLREHGNTFLIIIFEILLAIILFQIKNNKGHSFRMVFLFLSKSAS